MAEKKLVCLSLVFLAAAVALSAGHAHAHGSDICAKADYAPLCRAMVNGATSPGAATKAGIVKLITATKRAMAESLKSGKWGPLEVCKEAYGDAISDLETGLEYLKSRDMGSLNVELSAAMTDYATCDDAVTERGMVGRAKGILKTDSMLLHMASNCLYLASLT